MIILQRKFFHLATDEVFPEWELQDIFSTLSFSVNTQENHLKGNYSQDKKFIFQLCFSYWPFRWSWSEFQGMSLMRYWYLPGSKKCSTLNLHIYCFLNQAEKALKHLYLKKKKGKRYRNKECTIRLSLHCISFLAYYCNNSFVLTK